MQLRIVQQVRQLEEYFNTRLFDRTHNRISLTEAGTRVYAYADKIFELYGQMENAVREMGRMEEAKRRYLEWKR